MTTLGTGPLEAPVCNAAWEDALNRYVDGELPFADQPALFGHLAACPACRETMNAVLAFRRMSRQEHLSVPPAVDEGFFRRLDEVKRRDQRQDRAAQRRPLWHLRAPVSLGAAVFTALLLFVAGLLIPLTAWEATAPDPVVGTMERVEFDTPARTEAVYVFYPGLVVEAPKEVERNRPFEASGP